MGLIAKNEGRELQKALLQELVDVMPENRPKTEIEFDIDATHWDFYQIAEYTKKLCEEHEGKRNLRIKFSGKPNSLDC